MTHTASISPNRPPAPHAGRPRLPVSAPVPWLANAEALRDALARVLVVNPAFERLFGYDAGRAAGADLAGLVRPESCPANDPAEWIECRISEHRETLRRRRDGSLAHVSVACIPASGGAPGAGPDEVFVHLPGHLPSQADRGASARAERKYRSIFENAVEGIFQTTPAGRYLDVNPSLARIYGFASPAELIEHFKDIKNELYVDPGRRRRLRGHHGPAPRGLELRVPGAQEGRRGHLDQRERPGHLCQEGGIEHYEGTVVDITTRKRAEEALEAQRAFFRQLFENSPQAIVLIDERRNVLDANKGFEELFGYRAADIQGFGVRAYHRARGPSDRVRERPGGHPGRQHGAEGDRAPPPRRPAHPGVHDRVSGQERGGGRRGRLHLPGPFPSARPSRSRSPTRPSTTP